MKKKMIFKKSIAFVSILALGLGVVEFSSWIFQVKEVKGAAVNVTASVSETVSCTTSETATAFGTLSSGSITTASPNATTTLSCNSAAGCTLNVQDQGDGSNPGLYNATSTGNVIASASATLSAGTEGYGIQAATSSTGTGAVLTLSATYKQTGNAVGGLLRTATPIASSSSPTANREVAVTHKAAISGLTKAGDYTDTITYSCVGN
jgi:hypothetical protein